MTNSTGERQAGPLMKRVEFDGHEYILPSDAKLMEPYPNDGTTEEQREWVCKYLDEPLGGTW